MTSLRETLDCLERVGVRYAIRNAPERIDAPLAGDDVDVVVRPRQLADAGRVLRAAGFRRVREHGHAGHQFYVDCDDEGRWLKVDVVSLLRYGDKVLDVEQVLERRMRIDGVWVASQEHRALHAALRAASPPESVTLREKLARQMPVGLRRRGAVVAVLGPDGAGKGSVIACLNASLPVARTVVYFGHRRPAHSESRRALADMPRPAWRETAFILRRAVAVWLRLTRAYVAAWRGHVVLCDRHPLDIAAVLPTRSRAAAAVEQLVLRWLTPRPDAVVTLDASGEELFRRKQEHDPVTLERWRQGYLAVAAGPRGTVVSTAGSLDDTVTAVSQIVWRTFATRNRWSLDGRPRLR